MRTRQSTATKIELPVEKPRQRNFDPSEPIISEVRGAIDTMLANHNETRSSRDRVAQGVINALREMGRLVPDPYRPDAYRDAIRALRETP